MSKLKKILVGIAVLIGAFFLGGTMLPKEVNVSRHTTINAPAAPVFALVNDFKAWPSWSPWLKKDPETELKYSEPSAGLNAWNSWKSDNNEVGVGKSTITAATENQSLDIRLDFEGMGSAASKWTFAETDGKTKVTWAFNTEAQSIVERYFFKLFINSAIAKDFDNGLAAIKEIAEK